MVFFNSVWPPLRQVLDVNRFAIRKFYKVTDTLAGLSKGQIDESWEEVHVLWVCGNNCFVCPQAFCKTPHSRYAGLQFPAEFNHVAYSSLSLFYDGG
jgi:hypothetical protein